MNNKKILRAAMVGNILEYYDLGLIGFVAPVMSYLFFPTDIPILSIVATLGTFAVGFLARPIGALLFGHIGDKLGRKRALFLSVFLMSIPTLLIGVLPTYHSIGMMAPILLITFRFMQGLCTGGEYNGSAIFFIEHNTDSSRNGLYSSLISASALIGFFLAACLAYLCTRSGLDPHGWRIPFFFGVAIAIVGMYIRNNLDETPAFNRLKSERRTVSVPIKNVLLEETTTSLCTIGIGWCMGFLSLTLVGLNAFLTKVLLIPENIALITNMGAVFLYMLITPFMGMLTDRIGPYKLMVSVAISSIVLAYPIFYLLSLRTTAGVFFGQAILATLAASFIAPSNLLTFSLFPTKSKYTGISFNFSFGLAVFGGCSPLVISLLSYRINTHFGPTLYMLASAIIGLLSLIVIKKKNLLRFFPESTDVTEREETSLVQGEPYDKIA